MLPYKVDGHFQVQKGLSGQHYLDYKSAKHKLKDLKI